MWACGHICIFFWCCLPPYGIVVVVVTMYTGLLEIIAQNSNLPHNRKKQIAIIGPKKTQTNKQPQIRVMFLIIYIEMWWVPSCTWLGMSTSKSVSQAKFGSLLLSASYVVPYAWWAIPSSFERTILFFHKPVNFSPKAWCVDASNNRYWNKSSEDVTLRLKNWILWPQGDNNNSIWICFTKYHYLPQSFR